MNPLVFAILGYAGIAVLGALTVGAIIALGKSRFWMPFNPDYTPVLERDLSAHEAAFLEGRTRELSALGFRPIRTYRIANGPRPVLTRLWLDPTSTIICTTQGMVTSGWSEARILSMVSHGAGDAAVLTQNLPAVSVFAEMPAQETRGIIEARTGEALLAAHHAAVEEAGLVPVPVPQNETALLDEISRRHRRFCEFQERHGVLRRDEERARWVGTLRAHARAVFGQLLPSAADFEVSKLIRAFLAGSVVPAGIVLWSYGRGGAWPLLAQAAIFASGFVASVFFTARAWPWALILGSLPLFLGRWLGPEPALVLLIGALSGNVITLRHKGLVTSRSGGKRRMVRILIIWAAGTILFFSFYSYFSRQSVRRRQAERTTTKTPL
jgi:hypothetical protein